MEKDSMAERDEFELPVPICGTVRRRSGAYSVIVWPRVLRTIDSRARMNIFVTASSKRSNRARVSPMK
jgi:hypothetical protein